MPSHENHDTDATAIRPSTRSSLAHTLTTESPSSANDDAQKALGKQADDQSSTAHAIEKGVENEDLIVNWEGEDDPENPKNWSFKRKWAATTIISAFTFISPVSSSMIAPASAQVAKDFGITSDVVIAMTTSIFVAAYAIGPLFLGPLSEIYGRSKVLQLANVWYFVWNLGCGFAQSETELIIFRLLAGLGGSAPLAIGGAVIGDTWRTEERGMAIAVYSLAPLLGPVIGPVAGAWIAEKSTWRWVFWSTCIADAVVQLFGLFYLQETYAPLLLERKAKKIRENMQNDPEKGAKIRSVRTIFDNSNRHWRQIFATALTRPFVIFFHEPIVALLGIYMAFIYGQLYLFLTTIPSIFQGIYHQKPGIAGLNYIALGVGVTGASQLNARLIDPIYAHLKKKNGGVGKPEFRLPPMVIGTVLLPIGLFLAGWSAQNHIHWIAVDIGIALIGAGTIVCFQCIQTYVIDCFTLYAASALAAVSFLRSMAGFGFPLFAPSMFNALGYGKGTTVLAVIAIVLGCPAPWLFWHFGERIRENSNFTRK